MASLSLARPAETRFPLFTTIVALRRRLMKSRRTSAEDHLVAQARREAHRRAVDTLLR